MAEQDILHGQLGAWYSIPLISTQIQYLSMCFFICHVFNLTSFLHEWVFYEMIE